MKTFKWTPEEEKYAKELVELERTPRQIALALRGMADIGAKGFDVFRSDYAVHRKCLREGWYDWSAKDEEEATKTSHTNQKIELEEKAKGDPEESFKLLIHLKAAVEEKNTTRAQAKAQEIISKFPTSKAAIDAALTLRNILNETQKPTLDPHWKLLQDITKKHQDSFVMNAKGIMPPTQATTKILSLSDIHFPFANTAALMQAIKDHEDADIVVLNGDILEGYIFSVFDKSKSVAALDEYNAAFAFVDLLRKRFPKVVLVDGNHDVRASRAVKAAGLSSGASQVLRPNLIARIANGERLDNTGKLIEKLNFNNVFYQANESWYVKIGKTLFIHPHGGVGSTPGSTVKKQSIRFNTRYASNEIDSIVCGHTHQIYKGIINNQLLIEQGCMAGVLAYAWEPKVEYNSNGQTGYAVIYQDKDGNTDFNRSGPIYLGEAIPPKKSII